MCMAISQKHENLDISRMKHIIFILIYGLS